MTVSSHDTFLLFLAKAWHAMSTMPANNSQDIVAMKRACYDVYANYVPIGVTPKTALADVAGVNGLRAKMTTLVNGCGTRVVAVQQGNWPAMDKTAMLTQYAKPVTTALNTDAQNASKRYLHLYPTGSTYLGRGRFTPPLGHATASDWRIGINIEPSSIADALVALAPVLDAQNDINHIKFLAPGSAVKCDSVIVYMNKTDNYTTVKNAVIGAVTGLDIQDCFSIIWEQPVDGIGEAAEPPTGSFGTYRAAIATLSYYIAWQLFNARPSLDNFLALADAAYGQFGVTFANPHEQGVVTAAIEDQAWIRRLAN